MSESPLESPKALHFAIFIGLCTICALGLHFLLKDFFLSLSGPDAKSGPFSSAPLAVEEQLELRLYLNKEELKLQTYGWVDKKNAIARIPIDRALEIATEGEGMAK